MGELFKKAFLFVSLSAVALAWWASQAAPLLKNNSSYPSPTPISLQSDTPTPFSAPSPLPTMAPLPTEAPTQVSFIDPSNCPLKQVSVLMYHRIGDNDTTIYNISPNQFTDQMDWLVQNGYHTLKLDELRRFMKQQTCPPGDKYVVLTFDDNPISNYTLVYPTLKADNLDGIFFWIVNQIPFTQAQIQEMASSGNVEIQNHTMNHNLSGPAKMSLETLTEEIVEPISLIANLTGQSVTAISWPGGYYDSRSVSIAAANGIDMDFTTRKGPNLPGGSTLEIKREGIYSYTSLSTFIAYVINGK